MTTKMITVSKTTESFINCLAGADNLFSEICSAVEEMYGERQVDGIMEKDICPKFSAFKDEIEKLLIESITQNMLGRIDWNGEI